jgi:hypothetical protein
MRNNDKQPAFQMSKKSLVFWSFIIAKFMMQYFAIDAVYELHRDEFLHLDQGKHLAWGYLSVPPFTSWTSYLILLLGNSIFWVKFFPAVFGALTIVVVWKAIEELGGGIAALVLGSLGVLFSVLLRINTLYQPNSFDFLAWTFIYFCLLKYFNSKHQKWIYLSAIAFAIGFLNKYNIVFLAVGAVPAFLLTPHRTIFLNKHLYLASLLALVIVLPNLWWQYSNYFPVIHHMNLLAKTQLVNVNRADFIKEQFLYFLGSLWVIISAFYAFFRWQRFSQYRFFFWAFLCTILVFVQLRAKGYYAIGLYPILIAFGAVYIEHLAESYRLKWLTYAAAAMVILPGIPIFRVVLPLSSPTKISEQPLLYEKLGLLRWEDGKNHTLPQDFADMLGWKELAQIVDSAYEQLPVNERIFVLCDNYGQTGAINYYSRHPNINAISFHADYMDWCNLDAEIRHVILIQNADDDDPERVKEQPMFETVTRVGGIKNKFARECGTQIYVLKNAKISINEILKEDLRKNQWR